MATPEGISLTINSTSWGAFNFTTDGPSNSPDGSWQYAIEYSTDNSNWFGMTGVSPTFDGPGTYDATGQTPTEALYVRYRVTDSVGGGEAVASQTVDTYVDITAPAFPAETSPGFTQTGWASYGVDWSLATDSESGISSYAIEVLYDGGVVYSADVGDTDSATISDISWFEGMADGASISFRIKGTDAAGNEGYSDTTPAVLGGTSTDTTDPNVSSVSCVSEENTLATLTVSATDAGSGIRSIELLRGTAADSYATLTTVASRTWDLTTAGITSETVTEASLPTTPGSYGYFYRVKDRAGNVTEEILTPLSSRVVTAAAVAKSLRGRKSISRMFSPTRNVGT